MGISFGSTNTHLSPIRQRASTAVTKKLLLFRVFECLFCCQLLRSGFSLLLRGNSGQRETVVLQVNDKVYEGEGYSRVKEGYKKSME